MRLPYLLFVFLEKNVEFCALYYFDIKSMEPKKDVDLLRHNKKSILFNNRELNAIDFYCRKYRVTNRSKFMREAIITSILKKLDEDYPALF